jgi:hypothetical protein
MTLAAIGCAAAAWAQDTVTLPLSPQLPASARASGLGNAYLVSAPDADAIFYNVALMDDARGVAGSISRFGSASQFISAAASVAWLRGGLGFGVSSLSSNGSAADVTGLTSREDRLWQRGSIVASEQIAMVSYARTIFGFRVGGAGKLIDQRVADDDNLTGAADLGVARALGPVTLGFSARNLGPAFDYASTEVQLPTTYTANAATRTRPVGPLDVAVAGFSSWLRGDFYSTGAGVEVSYWPISGRTFTARIGYRWIDDSDLAPPTIGLGFTSDRVGIDYAFERIDEGHSTHRIALRLR